MRSDWLGLMLSIGVAGGLLTGLMSQAPAPCTMTGDHLSDMIQEDDEPARLPILRFDEPPLAAPPARQSIVPASLTSAPMNTDREAAPLPRKCLKNGRIPLIDSLDHF